MNNNKSPGIDNIQAELYKNGGLLKNKVHGLIKGIWREEKVPTDWKINIVVPTKTRVTNYSAKTIEECYCYAQDIKY